MLWSAGDLHAVDRPGPAAGVATLAGIAAHPASTPEPFSPRTGRREHMQIDGIPFGTTDWDQVPSERFAGEAGTAIWRTRKFGEIRVRMVEYSPGYVADHWCSKGHILLCLDGEMHTDLADGRSFTLTAGMSYQVADNAEAHRSSTRIGARLFVVD
jgi:hypothetical protein